VFFVMTPDGMSAYKSEVFLQQLKRTEPAILEKLIPVMNKHSGSSVLNSWVGSDNIIIPKVPDPWVFDDDGKCIFQLDNAFTEGLMGLAQAMRDG